MVRITIDDELKKQFEAADGVIELCDTSGQLVMQLTVGHRPIPAGWEPVGPELTEEELERRAAYEGPGISGEELLAKLRAKR
ncbi:MAG: hypothetical protein AAFV43_14655 [Planctomycetota bacterium]